MQFNTGSGWETLPAQDINYVPMAIEAETVAGRTPYSFLRVDDATTSSNTTELTSANLTEFWDLLGGTSSQYMHSSTGNGASLPSLSSSPSSPSAGMIWYDSGTKKINYFDGATTQTLGTSGGSVTGIAIGSGLVDGAGNAGTTITTSGTIALPAVGTAGTYYKVTTDAQGRVTAGVSSLTASDLPTGTATQWTTDSPNIYYSLGDVGIGTASPGSALEVSATSTSILRLRYDSSYYTDFSTDHLNAVGTSQNFDIQTNGTSRLSVRDSGNIGIGTTAPADLLDIRGPSYAYVQVGTDGTSSSQEAGVHILTKSSGGDELGDSTTKGWEIVGLPDAYSTASQQNSLNFYYYDGSSWQNDLYIDPTGNVGIGTTSTTSLLTVNGVVESTSGGIKFPDGTTQTTATVSQRASWTQSSAFSTTNTSPTDITGSSVSLTVSAGDIVRRILSCQVKGTGSEYGFVDVAQVSSLTLEDGPAVWIDENGDKGTDYTLENYVGNTSSSYVRVSSDGTFYVQTGGTLTLKVQLWKDTGGGTVYANNCKLIVKVE